MKLSLKWLSQYIDIADMKEKPEALADILTRAGLEVESIDNRAHTFRHVVVGHILEKKQHPNADRLTLCQVSTGQGRVHSIVCGARNHNADDRVVVALPGAVLPGNFEIKLSSIRGVESGGMLCSEKELGLSTESDGILILPKTAPIGTPFAEYQGFDDVILELKVTPNRADCLSHFGLARELMGLLDREINLPFKPFTPIATSTQSRVKLDVKQVEFCPRYAGCVMSGVKVGPSPEWLKTRLESVGLNSINNVVDVTNFVMMELGQPLHAFDLREIRGGRITVDLSRPGEVFTSLDGTEHRLDGQELMIRDDERPLALAGVVGGKNSGIQDDTTEIFIESAYFRSSIVRKTARKLGIETDSSYRFARGVDPDAILLALNRACELIQDVAGGEIYSEPHDHYPHPLTRNKIEISVNYISERMGAPVEPEAFVQIMKQIGCGVKDSHTIDKKTNYIVEPPLFRGDLEQNVDLVEEYARITGYDKIGETIPMMTTAPNADHPPFTLGTSLSRYLRAHGFSEAVNYAFISSVYQGVTLGDAEPLEAIGLNVPAEPVRILNPLNEDLNVMRTALVPGLIKNLSHNIRYGNSFGRLFERGYVFGRHNETYREDWRLGLLLWGAKSSLWQKGESGPLVLEAKAVVENLLQSLAARSWKWETKGDAPSFVHPGQWASLFYEGKTVGFIGTLHPRFTEELKTKVPCVVAELNLDLLLQGQPRLKKTQSISKFPAVERDLAFVMPQEMSAGSVAVEIKKAGGDLLKSVSVFDVFEGGALPPGAKSIAFRLSYQDLNETLSDERVNTLQTAIINSVGQKLSIQVR